MSLTRFEDKEGWRWYAETAEHFERGECYISVTKVLDHIVAEKLQNYMKTNSAAKQEKNLAIAADIGTRIHADIERDLKGEIVKPDSDCAAAFKQWQILKEAHSIKAVYTEKQVYHPRFFYAGTCDIVGSFNDVAGGRNFERALMDIKTGFFSIKSGWQMAAYLKCFEEHGEKLDGMVGLSVKRDGSVGQPFVYQHIDSCHRAFLAALTTFKMLYWNKLAKMNWKGLHVDCIQENK